MHTVSVHADTYERLKNIKKRLEETRGGRWSYDEIISKALDSFVKEVELDG